MVSCFAGISPGKKKGGKKKKRKRLSQGCALCSYSEHVSLSCTTAVNFGKQKKEQRGKQLLSTPGTQSHPEQGEVSQSGTALPLRAHSPEPPQPPWGQTTAAEGPPCHGAVTPLSTLASGQPGMIATPGGPCSRIQAPPARSPAGSGCRQGLGHSAGSLLLQISATPAALTA